MTYRSDILDELHALKTEATRLLATRADEWRETSSQKAKDIAADVKAFLSDFRDASRSRNKRSSALLPDGPRPRSLLHWRLAS
jgi:hypothetical protein